MPDTANDRSITPAFTVILVNYNGGAYVTRAINSLKKQTYRDFEVILLDNASEDGSLKDLDIEGLPDIRLIELSENVGFARGNNLAAKQAKGTWLALLNPDAEAAPDWLEQVAEGQKRHPDIRHFACAQYELHREGYLDGVGDAYLVFGIPWRGGYQHPATTLPEEGYCFSPCGASAIIHAATFKAFGGFDERFFCYCEDVDLGFRMQLAGMDCVFLPDASVRHAGSGLSDKVQDFATIHGTRNRLWTYWKNMPLGLLILTLPGHLFISAYLLVRATMTNKRGPTWRGLKDGLVALTSLRSKSSDWAPPRRGTSLWAISRKMAWNPFRLSKRRPHLRNLGIPPSISVSVSK